MYPTLSFQQPALAGLFYIPFVQKGAASVYHE